MNAPCTHISIYSIEIVQGAVYGHGADLQTCLVTKRSQAGEIAVWVTQSMNIYFDATCN